MAWARMPWGTRLRLGESVLVEITQIGKECHRKCATCYQKGDGISHSLTLPLLLDRRKDERSL